MQDPPERPKEHNNNNNPTSGMLFREENFQLWSMSGESCPEGTVPIRRTTEQDILRASNVRRFGRKLKKPVRRDSPSSTHEVQISISYKFLFFFLSCPLNSKSEKDNILVKIRQ